MSKDYIGKKRKKGVAGLLFFCVMAFVLTFAVSYSVTTYRNTAEQTRLNNRKQQDRLSKELDELFADNEPKESKLQMNSQPTAQAVDKKYTSAPRQTGKEKAPMSESEDGAEDTEVSAKPQKAVVPLTNGGIIKKFSLQPEYSEFFEDWRNHPGVDISGKEGEEVRSIADGTVTESYIDPLCGGTMKIDHGAFCSVYMGLDPENMEMNGTVVKRGDVVAMLQGNIMGETSEPHLHFEIIENEVHTDPMKYLG